MFKKPFKVKRLEENDFVEYTFLDEVELISQIKIWIKTYISQNKILSSHDPALRAYFDDIKSAYVKFKKDNNQSDGTAAIDIPIYKEIRAYIDMEKSSM
jgi:hypothetical protein